MTTETYRAASDARPRIWVPGVLRVDVSGAQARLRVGRDATPWDEAQDLGRWRHRESYVVTADLDDHERRVEALAGWPLLAALAESAPIRSVRDAVVRPELRLISIWFSPEADSLLSVLVERSGQVLSSVAGSLDAFAPDTRDDAPAQDRFELHQRVLRAATDDLVDERSLALAALIERAVGQPWSEPSELRALRDDLERELCEIASRAESLRREAVDIARRIREAPAGEDRCEIPVYGLARRRRHPELRVTTREGVAVAGDVLVIPAEDEWLVDDVAEWAPPTRALRVHREHAHERATLRRRRVVAAFVLLLIAASLVLAVALRRTSPRSRAHCAILPPVHAPSVGGGGRSEHDRAMLPSWTLTPCV